MKTAIIGAGAIGSLLAGYLVKKEERVILIAHPQQIETISRNGIEIQGVRGKSVVKLPVCAHLDEGVDLAILATKTQDLEKAIAENYDYLKTTNILSVQNGLRADKIIADRLGKDNLFSSIVMFGSTYIDAGRIIHNFEGDWILGKPYSGSKDSLGDISTLTSRIFPSPIADNIMGMKWLKLFLNANNCLPALLGKSMQEVFQNTPVCKISLLIWQEGWNIVNRANIELSPLPGFPIERLSSLISMPLDKAADIFSNIMTKLSKEPLYGSILQSIKRSRPSEIDYINGEFVRLAESTGQAAPLNARIVQMVHALENNKRFLSVEELINQTKEFLN